MRHTAFKVLVLACAFTVISVQKASASPQYTMNVTDETFSYLPGSDNPPEQQKTANETVKKSVTTLPSEPPAEVPEVPETPVEYAVLPGDTLTKIAATHQTTWNRIFNKNVQISNPDIIAVGENLTIPREDEQLTERALPQPVIVTPRPIKATTTGSRNTRVQATGPIKAETSAGNTYSAGYCTWYAKSRRPDLPNRLGNASSWVSRAAALGYATGTEPRAGAIGQQGNHVVYVESVNGDGTVTISEMNYSGLYVISSRTVSASNFRYIY